ncbi:MAG: acrylyl-CoA reductase (NADPH) [Alphaproteobacteria bacterium]
MTFRALVLEKGEGGVSAEIRTLAEADLPAGEVTIDVAYSTLNYKDGMILSGVGGMVRNYPHVPGIDFVGTVTESDTPDYAPGDPVILTGWEVGEAHWGGYARKARARAGWLVPLPAGLTAKRAMALGTAGLTAMLCILALEEHGLKPGDGAVLVTGAAGGVGSVAVAVLAQLGHHVVAGTGRPETHDYLRALGAADIVGRAELAAESKRVLQAERWAGVVDTVGSRILANAIASTRLHASVAACGLASGNDLPATVFPFILRGVNLLGIESIRTPFARRVEAWGRLAKDLPADKLDAMIETIPLADLMERSKKILAGQVRGRTVVDVNA